MKDTKSKKYKGVWSCMSNGKEIYFRYYITNKGTNYTGTYKTEREAALNYDLKLIDLGKQPVNILKKAT